MEPRSNDHFLFYRERLDNLLEFALRGIPDKVEAVPKDQLFMILEDEFVERIMQEFRVTNLTLYEEKKSLKHDEFKGNVVFELNIPYSGEQKLWDLRPNNYQMRFPHGQITPVGDDGIGNLILSYKDHINSPRINEMFDKEIEVQLSYIRFFIRAQIPQIEQFNKEAEYKVKQQIFERKERLKKLEGIIQQINIPLKHRADAPLIDPIKITQKIIKPLPPPPESNFKPEPGIEDKYYESILQIIRHVGRTFEQTPRTYAVHDEEELRNIILANLNGIFEGLATGETFRTKGKTDIRIEDKERAAFIAECKIWYGEKQFIDAIQQLLSYLTWRDCKTALVIFNKSIAEFSGIIKQIPEIIATQPQLVKPLESSNSGEWRYIFSSADDKHHRIYVHLFAFNLYTKKVKKK